MTLPPPDFTPNVDPVPGWTPPPMPPRTPVEGRFVRLEPISAERHGADLFAAFSADAEGREWTWRMQAPFQTREALDAWLRDLEAMTDTLYFAYVDRGTGRAFGNGALMSIVPASGSIETGSIMIGKEMQGTPASTEAQYLKARLAFDLGYRRFEWTCDPLNAASMRAAARLGFSYELTHRAAYVTKGRNRDKAVFAMLDRDWPQLRAAFESWLAPENFDGQGQQLQSLRDLTAPLLHHTAPETDPGPHRNALGQAVGAPVPNWTTPATPPADPAEGRFCRLEKLDADRHAGALFEANTSSDNWTYLPYGPFERLEDYSKWVASAAAAPDPYFHAILDPQAGRAVGVASLMRINPQAGSIEVGHINYSPLLQRHPAATEAMYLLMKRAFEVGYRRYEWKCDAANAPSRAAALRLGFVYEGIYRQATVTKGRNRDTAWFSILDHEWPALRAAFEAWLAPANFDADGQQRRSLAEIRAAGA